MDKQREDFEKEIKSWYPLAETIAKERNIGICDLYPIEWLIWQQAQKVAVPVLTNKMTCAIERKVEEQLLASAITADPFRLDGEKIFYAMIEAQEGST